MGILQGFMSWKRNPACKDYEKACTIDLDGLNSLVGHFKLGRKVVSLAGVDDTKAIPQDQLNNIPSNQVYSREPSSACSLVCVGVQSFIGLKQLLVVRSADFWNMNAS